jgi:hypothetical protein
VSDIQNTVDRYLALWNETDPAKRQAGIAELFTADAGYADPLAAVSGHEGIDALITVAQSQFAGFVFRPHGTADAHHNLLRFQWELGPDGVEAPVVGFDVAVLTESGQIKQVYGFLDKVPTA